MDNNTQGAKTKTKIIIIFILILVLAIMVFVFCKTDNTENIGFMNNGSSTSEEEPIEVIRESTNLEVSYSDDELSGEWSSENLKAMITLNAGGIAIEGESAKLNDNTVTITAAGTYYITGTITDGNIVVEANKEDEVHLVLENANITSLSTAPINVIKAKSVTITLVDGSENTITDAEVYTTYTDEENEEPNSAIFSKTDLIINGTGKLIVNANYADAIASKDGLKMISSELIINSADDGIRGKDYVAIKDANIIVNSKGDGIKSTNDTDTSLGYIKIEGGSIKIESESDGIQAETVLNISSDTEIDITTTGEIAKSNQEEFGGFGKRDMNNYQTQTEETTTEDSVSSKGLKAGTEITIESGKFTISSTDDSIHSNGFIILNGGEYSLSTGDDGIHADNNIIINNGEINIAKSYEGIESSYIEINDGFINLIASDDGINVGGGNDNSGFGGTMPGGDNFGSTTEDDSNRKLVINGGEIYVDATGDGLDSNGSISITGGKTFVIGPTSSGNGPLDYDKSCLVTGGELIVYGSAGMWQNISNTSTQSSLTFYTSGKSGDELVVKDSNGNVVASLTAEKSYDGILITKSTIQKGETYTLYSNDSEVGSITVNDIVNTYGTSSNNAGGGMRQGNPGNRNEF